jgi:tetratricopeptide (TPR) repeat protein
MRILKLATVGATLALTALALPALSDGQKGLQVVPKAGPLAGKAIYTNSHALIIGVKEYKNLPKDKWLDYADRDAIEMRNILVAQYGFREQNIQVLLNKQATKVAIETVLQNLADTDKVKEDDRVLIYFSGHGQTVKLPTGGDSGFLIPYDADIDLNNANNAGPYLRTCVRMDTIWTNLEATPAKHSLVIADACYSGLLAKSRGFEKLTGQALAALASKRAMQVLTAGRQGEEAWEDPRLGHGALTYKLLEELKSRATTPEDVFTAAELSASLQRSVANVTEGKQSPQFANYKTEGEFLFVAEKNDLAAPNPPVVNPSPKPGTEKGTDKPKNPNDKPKNPNDKPNPLAKKGPTSDDALKTLIRGELIETQNIARAVLAANKDDARAHALLGFSLLEDFKVLSDAASRTAGEKEIAEAERLDKDDFIVRCAIANKYYVAEDYEKALAEANKIVERDKGAAFVYAIRGTIAFSMENFELAEKDLKKALELDTNIARVRGSLGITFAQTGRFAESERYLDEEISMFPISVNAYIGKGMLYLFQQQWARADQAFRAAIRNSPASPQPYTFHAFVLAALGQVEDAETAARKAVALGPTLADAHLTLAIILGTQQRLDEEEPALREALRLNPKLGPAHAEMAAWYFVMNRRQDAYRSAMEAKKYGVKQHAVFTLLGIN